jgi:hypothetical protein
MLRIGVAFAPATVLDAVHVVPPAGDCHDECDLADVRTDATPELVTVAV